MTINYENIAQAIAALNKCAKENEGRQTDTGAIRVSDLCTDVAYFLSKVRQDHKGKWKSVDEWPKDGEPILMKLDNGKYQYSEWEEDGKGFNEGFAEINFGSGAMMRLPITYKVVAWRPLADIISELKYPLHYSRPPMGGGL